MPNLDPATRARLADALEGATPETFERRVLRLSRAFDRAWQARLATLLRTSERGTDV